MEEMFMNNAIYPQTLVGFDAPNFTAAAVMPNNEIKAQFNLYDYIGQDKCILFFYPLDFTFVCPSEIIAFNNKLQEFESRQTKVVAVSVDSQFSHLAYKNTPVERGGIGQVQFPMVADLDKEISRNYGVLHNESVALRGTFLIDAKNKVRHQVINDLPLGRNIDEALRMVDALDFHEKHGEVCPANWNQGKKAMKPDAAGVAAYLKDNAANL